MPSGAGWDAIPRHALGVALRVVAVACRVLSWALVALVVANVVLPAGPRAWLVPITTAVSRALPDAVSGLFVFSTSLEGAFRGDFAIVAIVLLVADWVLCRLSASLR